MALVLSIFGVAYAAFCIWLVVRILNRRERWAKRMMAAAVGLPVLYAGSFGPACWISSHADVGNSVVSLAYRPVTWTFSLCQGTNRIADALMWYAQIGAKNRWEWQPEIDLERDLSEFPDEKLEYVVRVRWHWRYLPPAV